MHSRSSQSEAFVTRLALTLTSLIRHGNIAIEISSCILIMSAHGSHNLPRVPVEDDTLVLGPQVLPAEPVFTPAIAPPPAGPFVQFILVPALCLESITSSITLTLPIHHIQRCTLRPFKWFLYIAWCVLNLEGNIKNSCSTIMDLESVELIVDEIYVFLPSQPCASPPPHT